MNTQPRKPKALRLAAALAYCDASVAAQAARELRRLHTELAQARAELEALGAGGVQPLRNTADADAMEATMFWNADDNQKCYDSIDEFLAEELYYLNLKIGDVRSIQRAIRLPNVTVRVTSISNNYHIEYKVIEAELGIKEGA